jgi:hypothetical protein
MLKDQIIKIAESRFSEGWDTAYIHLYGDSNRIRNYAGIWIKAKNDRFHLEFSGRLLGQDIFSISRTFDDLDNLADYATLVWDAYRP